MDFKETAANPPDGHDGRSDPKNGGLSGSNRAHHALPINKCELGQAVCGMIRARATSAVNALQRRVSDKVDRASNKFEIFITSAEFDKGLGKIIPPSRTPEGMPSRGPFRDAEVDEISDLLELHGKSDWSLRPRTFAILRMIDCMDILEGFMSSQFSDVSLPYTEENLPNVVKGNRARKLFLNVQSLVLTPSAEIEKNPMKHQRFARSADKYYIEKRELGAGGFGQVDLVISRASLKSYARKRIPRGRSFKKDNEVIQSFENELKVLKLLSHRHLVKLAGSYTDPYWVTLLMTPVADMNLARYLTADIDLQDRQICLRRFFGCLANAVSYLHKMEIRHKDLKPQNILIKGRNVLVTDFGTSHNWSDDTRSGTSGTVRILTKRYCAPEVFDFSYRDTASDIWSLGCVFLEMGTVLCNRTVQDLDIYYTNHGTHFPFIRGNREATELWIEALSETANSVHDLQPLALVKEMTELKGIDRPTALQVVTAISDFEGQQPFHGMCCSSDEDDMHCLDNDSVIDDGPPPEGLVTNLENSADPETAQCEDITAETSHRTDVQDHVSTPQMSPTVGGDHALDIRKESLARSSGKPLHTLQPYVEDYLTETVSTGPQRSSGKEIEQPQSTSKPTKHPLLMILDCIDINRLICQWPGCNHARNENICFQGRGSLESHYRSVHGVHEFSWSCLLGNEVRLSSSSHSPAEEPGPKNDQSLSSGGRNGQAVKELRFTLLPVQDQAYPSIETGCTSRSRRSRHAHDPAPKLHSFTPQTTGSVTQEPPSTTNTVPGQSNIEGGGPRFSLLPGNRRPEQTAPLDNSTVEPDIYRFISPEPLHTPSIGSIHSTAGSITASNPTRNGGYPLPNSTLAPSYILATTNRFTRSEVASLAREGAVTRFRRPPLFVYGSFMFPSVLTQQADKFVSQGGFYSESSQRRVTSDAYDWANVNMSLQHAAERMTPAILTGYDRWKPRGLSCAAISDSWYTPEMVGESETSSRPKDGPEHEVQGFLIFGLSEDAMKCCDELFCSSSSLKDAYGKSHPNISVQRRLFSRKLVSVSFSLKGGEMISIEATTYVSTQSATTKRRKWDINKFVRSRGYHRHLLISEEKELAKIMGITFVLPGDALSDAILRRNVKDITELLRQGYDVNAPCQAYGRALQTASAQGFEDTVNLLLENGAEVNATGGQYESALIAATVQGHEGIARILIKAGADVLKEAVSYISPLYQAVSHSDVDMVLLLLERGAWLSRNYGELLDLASERGNEEILNLLHEYDVRDLRLKLPASAQGESGSDPEQSSDGDSDSDRMRRRRHSSSRNQVVMKPAKIVRAVICRALILKGQRGKWTGIKGVNIMRTAIEAGVPPQILDLIAPHLSAFQDILDFLKRAVFDYASQKHSPVTRSRRAITSNHVLGTFTELIDESGGDENAAEGPNLEQVPSRRVHFASEPQVTVLPWEPTSAPPHPVAAFCDPGLDAVSYGGRYSRKVVCPACEGRGGRRGTGYPCSKCHSTGRYRDTRCSACKGVGQIFSERNICHNCDGARFMYTRDRLASEPSILSENQTGQPWSSPLAISQRRSREQPDSYTSQPRSNVDYASASLPNGSSRRTISRPRDGTPRSPNSQPLDDDPPPPYSSQEQVFRSSR